MFIVKAETSKCKNVNGRCSYRDLGLSIIFLDHTDMMLYSFSYCVFLVDIHSISVGNILLQDWKNSFLSLIGVKHNYVAQRKLNLRL